MRAVFADPKTDFVFKRIFGSEVHKPLLVALLDALLELDEPHRIVDLQFLPPEQHLPIEELKYSIVNVKCRDASGHTFVVKMQVLNVEGFEKPVVYNGGKAYVSQLRTGEDCPALADVVGVTICDFEVWSNPPLPEGRPVPMLSRWRMQEHHGGKLGLSQIQHVFLELPKYAAGDAPTSLIDKWAFFFREAENVDIVPLALSEGPFREALEVARIAHFRAAEIEAYDRGKMAEQDARGALSLSFKKGIEIGREEGIRICREEGIEIGLARGREEGLRSSIRMAATLLGISLAAEEEAQLGSSGLAELEGLKESLLKHRCWPRGQRPSRMNRDQPCGTQSTPTSSSGASGPKPRIPSRASQREESLAISGSF